jgi:hypothetical protein
MKKLLFGAAVFAALTSCSTATLININVDGDSFIPAANRSQAVAFTAGASVNTPIPDGGLAVPTPSLNFLTRIALKINAGVVSSAAGAFVGTFELFVAPSSSSNLYDPANKVPTSNNCTTDTVVNGTDPVDLDLTLTSTSPAACATAFTRIQSGQFKIGARVSGAVTANTTVTFTINNFDLGISGYPVKLLQ